METAEELYGFCYDELIPAADGIARIKSRDAAVALAAKRELLEEIRSYAAATYPESGEWHRRYGALISFLDLKHCTQPTQSQEGEG